jgi:predicted phage-related endonuclease
MIIRKPITDEQVWLHDRRGLINASEVGIVCGVPGAYGSRAALFAEKMGLRSPQIDPDMARRGHFLEAAVFEAAQYERPEWEFVRGHVHVIDTDLRIGCTPDGFAAAPGREGFGIVQAKTIARSVFRQRWLVDPDGPINGDVIVPPTYRLQTICERMLNADRCPWAVLAVLIVDEFTCDYLMIDIEPDPVLEARIVFCCAEFFKNYLDPGIMPPFEPQRDEQLIKHLFPKDDGTTIDLSSDNRALVAVDELIETQAALKRLATQEGALKTELSGKLGPHTFGNLGNGRRLSWKLQHRKGYAIGPADFRVLRIQELKG